MGAGYWEYREEISRRKVKDLFFLRDGVLAIRDRS